MIRSVLILLVWFLAAAGLASAQPHLAGAGRIRLELERLRVLGSVLMTAAHPDDENTALLAWFARGRKVRTAYLALTRGEGGQNLIGPEQSDALGLIRTQELLAARRIDGAEQYFTRAIDFGFSKSAEESFRKWGREEVLRDMVWVIRRFRPDVIVLRFSGTSRDGHGHHQASALLGEEAYRAAADPQRFPEQLQWTTPWQARRLMWNTFGAAARASTLGTVEVDVGAFDPVLGYSYSEIAGMSRSMHRSQGFGAAQRRGSAKQYLVVTAGEPAQKDPFEGIDISWNRVPGGAAVDQVLAEALRQYDPSEPARIVPLLARARALMVAIRDPWAERKLTELDEVIALCAGLWVDAAAERAFVEPGSELRIRGEVVNRCRLPARWLEVVLEDGRQSSRVEPALELPENQPVVRELSWKFAEDVPYSGPFWLAAPRRGEAYQIPAQLAGLAENPPVLAARFRIEIGPATIELARPVRYRYVDRVLGECTRRLEVGPPVAVRLPQSVVLFTEAKPRPVEVELTAQVAVQGEVRLVAPEGWRITPSSQPFRFDGPGEQSAVVFQVEPPQKEEVARLQAVARVGAAEVRVGVETIAYPHIEPVIWFPPATARLVRSDVRVLVRRVGYVMGAGDEVPEALRQLGCEVTLLTAGDLARGDLSRFDAVVTGVRAFNVRADLRANLARLLQYVASGGTLVVQYNTLEPGLPRLGPYPFRVGRERVTVEEAPVSFPDPDHPLLRAPNRIGPRDFEGWVQERGLYFASEWDARYQPLLVSADPGEKPLAGGTLAARYGKGVYIFTAYAWFRQLPAGVPGAYRVFANLLSAGQSWR